jgi:Domain of unknown function (DUF6817)
MFEFAQTNVQLYRQMNEAGYSLPERERVASAYRFLMPMFSGQYRGNEKPFIAHLVGTASILVSNRQPITLVLAGVLHAVYMSGDFGFQPGTRQTQRKRRCIRNLAGAEVEAVVAAYDDMRWDAESLKIYLASDKTMSDHLRSALTLQLANTLDDFLDHGVNYCAGLKFDTYSSPEMQAELIALCRLYGWPELCSRLEQVLADFNAGATAVGREGFMAQSALLLPPIARRKLLPTSRGWLVRRMRRIMATLK